MKAAENIIFTSCKAAKGLNSLMADKKGQLGRSRDVVRNTSRTHENGVLSPIDPKFLTWGLGLFTPKNSDRPNAQLLKIFPSKCLTVGYLPSMRVSFVGYN